MSDKRLVIHEDEVEEKELPGRMFKQLVGPGAASSEFASINMVRVAPGTTITPAHSHAEGEEIIYIMSGSGAILIDGEVNDVKKGCIVVLPRNSIHMTQNNGKEELKLLCFFAPPTEPGKFVFHKDVEFPK